MIFSNQSARPKDGICFCLKELSSRDQKFKGPKLSGHLDFYLGESESQWWYNFVQQSLDVLSLMLFALLYTRTCDSTMTFVCSSRQGTNWFETKPTAVLRKCRLMDRTLRQLFIRVKTPEYNVSARSEVDPCRDNFIALLKLLLV